MTLKVKIVGLMVNNQENAFKFYTGTLGFVKKIEIDVGGGHKWISVVSTDSDYVQLSLEPNSGMESSARFQADMFASGVAATAFEVDNIDEEYQRLKDKGVVFKSEPKDVGGGMKIALFDDTVGNLIQIYQAPSTAP